MRLSRKSIQFKYVTPDKEFTNSNKFREVKDKNIVLTMCNELIGCLNLSDVLWLLIDLLTLNCFNIQTQPKDESYL